jgi:hypothetical protein
MSPAIDRSRGVVDKRIAGRSQGNLDVPFQVDRIFLHQHSLAQQRDTKSWLLLMDKAATIARTNE